MSQNHLSFTLSWPKPILFVCSLFFVLFLPLPWLYFHKGIWNALAETTRLLTSQDRIVSKMYNYGGPEGYCHIKTSLCFEITHFVEGCNMFRKYLFTVGYWICLAHGKYYWPSHGENSQRVTYGTIRIYLRFYSVTAQSHLCRLINWIVKNRTVWSFNSVHLQNAFTNYVLNIYVITLSVITKNW